VKVAVETLGWISLVAYTVLAVATIDQWRRRRDRASAWAAACFGTLGVVVIFGQILPDHPHGSGQHFAQKVEIAIFLLFPYLLYRFTTAFRVATTGLERLLGLMTVVMVAWTFALPTIPVSGEARSTGFTVYLVAFLVHWTVLSTVAAIRLWRAGGGQPSVARRRMRLLALATATLTLALFAVAATNKTYSTASLASSALAIAAALAFLLGFVPPAVVRALWRRPDQPRVQQAIQDLVTLATSRQEIAQRVLEPMAAIVGARAITLYDEDGEVVGSYGSEDVDSPLETVEQFDVEIPSGRLNVCTSPYAPFFGNEELRTLETLGGLTGIALDRVRLFQQEHEVRLALERADEIKTNFIALASHELRTPVTTIHGLAATLNHHGGRLDADQRRELREALERQSERMAKLVDQLLDLSRLDADAIEIKPELFNVRERLEEIVAAAAAERKHEVHVGAPEDLEASADPAALERIVGNLVTNALRYGTPPVEVKAEKRDRHLRVFVEDQGEGVPPQFVPELFERFTRGGPELAAGTGLGLAIARSYARAHNGDLFYEDVEPHGARFQLILPTKYNGNGEPLEVEAHRRFSFRRSEARRRARHVRARLTTVRSKEETARSRHGREAAGLQAVMGAGGFEPP
jgi:signal transduction histidine kinase